MNSRKKNKPLQPIRPQPRQVTNTHQIEVRSEQYSGMLPHPDHLQRFKEIDPSLIDLVIESAQKEGIHRREIESRLVRGEITTRILGMAFGFLAILVFCATGIYFLLKDAPTQGATIIGLSVAVSIIFVLRQRPNHPKENK